MPDANETTQPVVELSHWYDATPERVFHAWTDAEALARWMGPFNVTTEVHEQDLRVGGGFSWTMSEDNAYPVKGIFLVIEPPRHLVFTWVWQHGDYEGIETEVDLTMAPEDGGTRLTLVHKRLVDATAREKHTHGWTSCLHDNLTAFLAS